MKEFVFGILLVLGFYYIVPVIEALSQLLQSSLNMKMAKMQMELDKLQADTSEYITGEKEKDKQLQPAIGFHMAENCEEDEVD